MYSIPTPQPVIGRPMFGHFPSSVGLHSFAFVSKASIQNGVSAGYGLKKNVKAVENCRLIGKKDMKWNDKCPDISVDPETYSVKLDQVTLNIGPAKTVALSTGYYLF